MKSNVARLLLATLACAAVGSSTARAQPLALCALESAPVAERGAVVGFSPAPICALPAAVDDPSVAWTRPITAASARSAFVRARELLALGRADEAIVSLRVVDWAMPELADRVALVRADAELAAGQPRAAAAAYRVAAASIEGGVAARGRVGVVRALLAAGDRRAIAELAALEDRYRDLPQALDLRLATALARIRWGEISTGTEELRAIDLESPGHEVAARARAELAALHARGIATRELSQAERVDRVERLARSGPADLAQVEVTALLGDASVRSTQRARVLTAGARIARDEGRLDDSRALEHEARALVAVEPSPDRPVATTPPPSQTAVRARLTALARARTVRRLDPDAIADAVSDAARIGANDAVDALLDALRTRTGVSADLRFDVAMSAAGVASDDKLVALLDTLLGDPGRSTAARYHRARALERMGRSAEADGELRRVIETDRSELRWYALWATLRLADHERRAASAQASPGASTILLASADTDLPPAATATDATRAPEPSAEVPVVAPNAVDAAADEDLVRAAALLEPVARTHGDAYPWIGRALSLARLGDADGASDELFETYIAWRQARGLGALNAGTEAVYRGGPPRLPALSATRRRSRAALDARSIGRLADAASLLGDEGTAIFFVGRGRANGHPRPYAVAVERAAARHGLDPNLLWAVMRVESVYSRRIVSYAGAIGLMQIMPRTGRLIAGRVGHDGFSVADLLDPAVNVDFAAWYLRSLIDRFDGRLPLAVAAYNGGPHNVRKWMDAGASAVPLDAFLERIPFGQTWRYVRRVLGHYRAYRAQDGLGMVQLDVALPAAHPDTLGF